MTANPNSLSNKIFVSSVALLAASALGGCGRLFSESPDIEQTTEVTAKIETIAYPRGNKLEFTATYPGGNFSGEFECSKTTLVQWSDTTQKRYQDAANPDCINYNLEESDNLLTLNQPVTLLVGPEGPTYLKIADF